MPGVNRLLGAVVLGAALTAAVAAAITAQEYGPVHKSPAGLAESADSGRVIVKLRARTTTLALSSSGARGGPRAASALGNRLGVTLTDGRVLGTRTQVLKSDSMSSTELATALAKDSDVEWVEVDHRRFVQTAPNDPLYAGGQTTTTPAVGQWYLRAPDSTVVSAINMEPAWAITHGLASVVIADVDTGVTDHPDLSSKFFTATFSGTSAGVTPYGYDFVDYANESHGVATANDGDGADPDPSDPGDDVTTADLARGGALAGQNCPTQNSSWHGTQTAGILGAATNNNTGMAGVGYDTMIVPVRALGKCGGYDSDIIAAAQWAGGVSPDTSLPTNIHPARVINMSLGGAGSCGSYQDALTLLRDHGVLVVAAAGNDTGLAVDSPANCQPANASLDPTPVVIAVAGLRQVGDKVGYSDIGPEVTIAAPAGNCVNTEAQIANGAPCVYPILTTVNTGTTTPVAAPAGASYTTSFGDSSLGTSFSTPMVAGTVALMLAANPALSNAQVVTLLKRSATPFPTSGGSPGTTACTAPTTAEQAECYCTTATCGAGMLNAGAAVAAAHAALGIAAPVAGTIAGSTSVVVGNSITLTASGSTGSSITYQWLIHSGGSSATLGNSTSSSVALTGTSAGSVVVELIVTDSTGAISYATTTVSVVAASSNGSSGGGASSPAWLLALAFAGWLLTPRSRQRGN